MAQCPNCHSQIEIGSEYFGGLFTCPECQSVYFISFDGVPESSPTEEVANEAPSFQEEVYHAESPPEPFNSHQFENPPQEQASTEMNDPAPAWGAEYHQVGLQGEPQSEFQNEPYGEPPQNEFQEQQDYAAQPLGDVATDPLQEIVDFGNSEAASTPISYSLRLKGIDLIQNIEDLQGVFSDMKLELNFDQLKSKIRNGELFIENIKPGKAAVISQRLRALPLTMIWEQKIYE